jgi:GAF domain-containing protein
LFVLGHSVAEHRAAEALGDGLEAALGLGALVSDADDVHATDALRAHDPVHDEVRAFRADLAAELRIGDDSVGVGWDERGIALLVPAACRTSRLATSEPSD